MNEPRRTPDPAWATEDRLLLDVCGFRAYGLDDGLIGGLFAPRFKGDLEAARAFVQLLREHRARHGVRAAFVLRADGIVALPPETRRYFQAEATAELLACNAVVTRNPLARAIASVFAGLAPIPVPLRIFATLDEAEEWAREHVRSAEPPDVSDAEGLLVR